MSEKPEGNEHSNYQDWLQETGFDTENESGTIDPSQQNFGEGPITHNNPKINESEDE